MRTKSNISSTLEYGFSMVILLSQKIVGHFEYKTFYIFLKSFQNIRKGLRIGFLCRRPLEIVVPWNDDALGMEEILE